MRNQLITMIVVLASATVVSTMARAAGESKNQAPFTRQVQVKPESRGEAKNQLPFTASSGSVTRLVRNPAFALQEQAIPRGEAKNELPFTARRVKIDVSDVLERYASAHPYGREITTERPNGDAGLQWRYLLGGRWYMS